MSLWMIWFIIAIVFIVMEIFTPTFFFLSLGIGAIMAGLLSFVSASIPFQILVFVVIAFLVFLWMKKVSGKWFDTKTDKTNVYALQNKTGIVTKTITSETKGYIKIGGEEWPATTEDEKPIDTGQRVRIISIEGNKLIVTAKIEEA